MMTTTTETLIYALPHGETDRYTEVLISTQCKTTQEVDTVIERATADGFHSFRVTFFDPSQRPDFGRKVVNI